MDSTVLSPAALESCASPADLRSGAVSLPAAVSAPAALIVAVEVSGLQETSALARTSTRSASAHTAAFAAAPSVLENRIDVMGSPPRGTPV